MDTLWCRLHAPEAYGYRPIASARYYGQGCSAAGGVFLYGPFQGTGQESFGRG